VEYAQRPNTEQIAFAHVAIDAGANAVIGHHPHVVQPLEMYKGKPIFYSLGNFVFDQEWSNETKQGLMVKLTINKTGVLKNDYLPVTIEDYAQPRFVIGEEADQILSRL
jgi:poly-gamma-glutamate synthesis protein (capsule biosynthesis protein)